MLRGTRRAAGGVVAGSSEDLASIVLPALLPQATTDTHCSCSATPRLWNCAGARATPRRRDERRRARAQAALACAKPLDMADSYARGEGAAGDPSAFGGSSRLYDDDRAAREPGPAADLARQPSTLTSAPPRATGDGDGDLDAGAASDAMVRAVQSAVREELEAQHDRALLELRRAHEREVEQLHADQRSAAIDNAKELKALRVRCQRGRAGLVAALLRLERALLA